MQTLLQLNRFEKNMKTVDWETINIAFEDCEVSDALLVIDVLLAISSVSVANERLFSHMKVTKSKRRGRLGKTALNDLLTVKLETNDVEKFDPENAFEEFKVSIIEKHLL